MRPCHLHDGTKAVSRSEAIAKSSMPMHSEVHEDHGWINGQPWRAIVYAGFAAFTAFICFTRLGTVVSGQVTQEEQAVVSRVLLQTLQLVQASNIYKLPVSNEKSMSVQRRGIYEGNDDKPDRITGYIASPVIFGHVHIAKTGGTSLNGNLSTHFERICGHKGYSYDAVGIQKREQADLYSRFHLGYSRKRVPHPIMEEIGYEDCDWISQEADWGFWKKFVSWDPPIELHVPCRDPIDHLMSQCNHVGKKLSCSGAISMQQVKGCLIDMGRYSHELERIFGNDRVKCFDWRVGYTGKYFTFMGTKLQRRRIETDYKFQATNKNRNESSECLWDHRHKELRNKVRSFLIKNYDYYSYCNKCMGSSNDLFVNQSVGVTVLN